MPDKKPDQRLEAFNAIVSRLSKLDDDSQQHVLRSVVNWFARGAVSESVGIVGAGVAAEPTHAVHRIRFAEPGDISPKQFMLEKSPQSNVERVACLAYYLTHHREVPEFKTLEISKLNTEAAQPKFSNASYSVRDASNAGLLVSGTKGVAKQLSAIGEQFVLALPDHDAARAVLRRMMARKRKKGRRKKKRPK